jgi:hypothetical protein
MTTWLLIGALLWTDGKPSNAYFPTQEACETFRQEHPEIIPHTECLKTKRTSERK